MALCAPDGREWIVSGVCEGWITTAAHGKNGFGYDPLFVPDGYVQSFAELDADVKNKISHRAHALRLAAKEWKKLFI